VEGVSGISRRSYLATGRRLADLLAALESLLQSPHVRLFECSPVTDEVILLAHDPRLIPEVEADPF
jgi:acetoin utilization deacetylase AcuC-like enzyme